MKRHCFPDGFLSIWFLLAAGGLAVAEQGYRFTLDGRPLEPYRVMVTGRAGSGGPDGDPAEGREDWSEGDVIAVQEFRIMLDGAEAWHFVSRPAIPNVLFRKEPGGREVPVAVVIADLRPEAADGILDPLARLSPAERAGLRGLRIDAPLDRVRESLAGVPLERVALTLTDQCRTKGEVNLPELPPQTTWLELDEGSEELEEALKRQEEAGRPASAYAALGRTGGLRGLRLTRLAGESFDARQLAGLEELRWLKVDGPHLAFPEALAGLRSLRVLDLSSQGRLDSVGWATGLDQLEFLGLGGTAVKDLAPLAGLAGLKEIMASGSQVKSLGTGGFAALRQLNVLACPLAEEEAETFRTAHPRCRVLSDFRDSLVTATRGVTRLRVRSGGTCHRNPQEEKTLLEMAGPEKIAALVEDLKFEDGDPFHCMCCGDPTLEFYRGDRLVVTLGFHHGHGLRWAEGPWPGDVRLEGGSALRLCDWLEQRGVKGAGDELKREAGRKAAAKRRSALYRNILSGDLGTALGRAESAEEAAAVFREKLPDDLLRARVVFALYGCPKDSWNIAAGMDEFILEHLIPGCGPEAAARLVEEVCRGQGREGAPAPVPAASGLPAEKDPSVVPAAGAGSVEARRGLARWLFESDGWERLDRAVLSRWLPELAGPGLTSARPYNRARTMAILGAMGTPEAVTLLKKSLGSGGDGHEKLKPEEADEPGGMVSFHPGTLDLPEGAPDSAHAAVWLLRQSGKEEKSGTAASSAEVRAAVDRALETMAPELRKKIRSLAEEK